MSDRTHYECIDSSLGGELWRLDDPETPRDMIARLERHCEFCSACRLRRDLGAHLSSGLKAKRLTLPVARPSSRARILFRWATGAGATALAAGLTMIAILPPVSSRVFLHTRAPDDAPAVTRPVSEEIIAGGNPSLAWTPLEGAREYEVSVRSVDSEFEWTGTTASADIAVSDEVALPQGQRYRVTVTPTPSYAAPSGSLRSTFRTGNLRAVAAYRLASGSRSGRFVGLAGALALLTGVLGMVVTRRR